MSNTPEIEVVTTTLAEFDKVGAGIAALKSQYAGIVYPVETTKGMKDAVAARAALRAPRVQIEKLRKDAKAPLLEIGRKLDAEAKRITAEISALEDPIDEAIKAEEARKEAEKAARVAAELARMERITAAIAEISALPGKLARANSKAIADARDALEGRGLSTEQFEERLTEALNSKAAALAELDALHNAAVAHEAEQDRIVAERAELERLRQAEAERQREEAARLAAEREALEAQRRAQEAEAQRVRDEQAAAELKARQEREAAEAQAKAARDAEEARIAAAAKKLADDQAEFARQQAEAVRLATASNDPQRQAPETTAAVAVCDEAVQTPDAAARPGSTGDDEMPPKPSADRLVEAVAVDFNVPLALARDWLRTTDFNDQALPLALAA